MHITETTEDYPFYESGDLTATFDPDNVHCKICSDTRISAVEYKTTLLETNPIIVQTLKTIRSGREFTQLAEEKRLVRQILNFIKGIEAVSKIQTPPD